MQTNLRRGFGPAWFIAAVVGSALVPGVRAYADCVNPANAIEAENCLPGNPPSAWDVAGEGDASIQGFATDISVDRGQTVQFKVDTDASNYVIDIYRLGYYAGDGARKVASVTPSAPLPQSQPACLTDPSGLVDCGNWAVSASWAVPANATSGIYVARLERTDTGGASHMVFVVRHDGGSSDLLFQASDTTWQAYNRYGGSSLYGGSGPGGGLSGVGRAYKVSYNRPFTTREYAPEDWVFNAEYPMVRWLERNGYDVSYFTGVDSARRGDEIARHKVFLSVGHDEYWSQQQRDNVELARDQQFPGQTAPVHLAFFSGNEIFWKTRWEASIDASAASYRTLVCYKETHEGAKIDPSPEWTGTWRDPRFSPPADGGRPENELSGTIFTVNGIEVDSVEVPAEYAQLRFWRNTPNVSTLSGAQVWSSPLGTLGYEWDEELDNGFRPAGLVRLSQVTVNVAGLLQDFGSTFAPGTATHRLALHRSASGALVFGAGTVQWSWGLDTEHDRDATPTSADMQQATVNLFADMGAQPATLQAGLVAATASTDASAPASTITSPADGATVPVSTTVAVQGSASDAGGVVGGVEVSVDGGATWHPASGRAAWSYAWTPTQGGTFTLRSRAVDDSGNIEVPGPGISVTVGGPAPPQGSFSIWGDGGNPTFTNLNDAQPIELGLKFRSSLAGYVTGFRFYKGDQDTGTHVGSLWSATGTLLASATFAGESASGWQQVTLGTPVLIAANTTYVVSCHSSAGYYVATNGYFAQAFTNGPLTALADGTDGPNGLYQYGPSAFPTQSFGQANYWVDVVFNAQASGADTTPPSVVATTPPGGAVGVSSTSSVSARFSEPLAAGTVDGTTVQLRDAAAQLVPASVTWDAVSSSAVLQPAASLSFSTTYTATVTGGSGGVTDVAGNPLPADFTWTFTTEAPSSGPVSIWGGGGNPTFVNLNDGQPIELGVKFRSSLAGYVTALRFYKGDQDTGTHVGSLWNATGTLLASATFTGETTSGWQEVPLAAPVPIAADTTYVVSCHSSDGYYVASDAYFTQAFTNGPLTALASGSDGPNGLYQYGASAFPTQAFAQSNYWVDLVFSVQPSGPDTTPPVVVATTPADAATGAPAAGNVSARFSEPLAPGTINATTVALRDAAAQIVPATITWDSVTSSAVIDPAATLAYAATFTATVKGGAGGVTDSAGNALAADVTWTFTTEAQPAGPVSIWEGAAAPTLTNLNDGQPIELGVKFRSSLDGFITALRFYKGDQDTGTHVGNLWSATGTLLASATFSGETASGWQQVPLASPVAITANTTYVASYHSSAGYYVVTDAYFAQAFINGPLTALADGTDGPNGLFQYGASGFPAQSFGRSNYWADVVFSAQPSGADTTPPVLTAVAPTAGATGVAAGVNVIAGFNEPMASTTIGAATFELRNAASQLVPAAVTWDSVTNSAVLDPTSALAHSTTYTATIKGGLNGVTDVAGNPLAADFAWSFTTEAPPSGLVSIWGNGGNPSFTNLNDGQPIELGLKFRSDLAGYITALRFYKGDQDTGTHTGSLWSATGTLLGSAAFGAETASGWQEAPLATPVAIAADTTYVASYHSSDGYYVTTDGYLTQPFVNGPLTALADGSDGPNGLYEYGPSSFPTQVYAQSNFWADVVFSAQASGPDTTPPSVVATTPAAGATDVQVTSPVSGRFSEPLDPSTVTGANVELRDAAAQAVPASVAWDPITSSAVLDATAGLAYSTAYTATLKGGAGGLADVAGNALAGDVTWTFTTQPLPPPPPPEGPGGPVLVISYSGNPFSRYPAEILRAEGLNAFRALDISTVDATVLTSYDVAILGEMPLTAAQVTMLADWVTAGGNLIALRPDKQLAGLLGLTPGTTTLSDAYLKVDTAAAPGLGIVGATLQFHGAADRYTLAQATAVATLYTDATTASSDPAVSLRAVGAAGGEAAAFTFDLARSVVYTRQGNPAWAGQKRDGQLGPIRSDDLYYGDTPGDERPDWVNLDKVAIPQADELQRLLVNLVLHVSRDRLPLPRFWYFPRGEKALVVMTADNHGGANVLPRFAAEDAASPSGCSVADWECVRSTAYLYLSALPDDTTAKAWEDKGFEIAAHVNTNCANWTPATLPGFYSNQIAAFTAAFPSLAPQTTHRVHCIAWSDWATQPEVELQNGIRLDTNYYYWPDTWVADRPGFFTGSGMPMRFAALDGSAIDVYQAATQMTDESGQSYPFTIDTLLDRALGIEGYYGAFTANIHADGATESTAAAIVASAQARGVPVVSARQLLTWLDGRNSSSFADITWNGSALTFDVAVGAGANGLEGLLPTNAPAGATLTALTRGGGAVPFTTQTVKGVEYAVFTAQAGSYEATYTSGP